MKKPWRYIFPGLFGLLIYASIRLVTDVPAEDRFWDRSFRQNAVEIVFTMSMGYLFYGVMRYVLRQFEEKRRRYSWQNVVREFGVMVVLSILFINPLLYLIHYLANDPVDLADIVIANLVVLLYNLLYYAIVRGNQMLRLHIEQQTQVERLKNENLQTELKFLKAQYHPHFLFNALNTIYFQMDQDVAAAKKTVEQFSELLRYQLYDQHQLVPIRQELDYLRNFIDLQRQRSSDRLKLEVQFDPALQQEKVYPLLLQPLVENAFKYVGGAYELCVKATRQNGRLYFQVQNALPEYWQQKKEPGIGLENLQRRLSILYPGQHSLHLTDNKSTFTAELILPL